MQRELFSTPMDVAMAQPTAGATEPTSQEAAEELKASGKLETQCMRVLYLVHRWPGCTSLELAQKSGYDRYLVARRLPQLEAGGMIFRGSARTCLIGNRKAFTWWRAR